LAIADRLADDGAVVIGADVTAPPSSTKTLSLAPGTITPWHLDVTAELSWSALLDALAGERPAILVNNAGGVLERSLIHESSVESWERTIALNLTSAYLGMRCILPLMLDAGTGVIVNMCSISGFAAHADAAAYQAAKSGIRALTKSAAIAYGPRGVRVNAVTPSIIATPAVARETPEHIESFVGRVPVGRLGDPHEVAAAVAFLVGDDASFITGGNLVVDGGFLA